MTMTAVVISHRSSRRLLIGSLALNLSVGLQS